MAIVGEHEDFLTCLESLSNETESIFTEIHLRYKRGLSYVVKTIFLRPFLRTGGLGQYSAGTSEQGESAFAIGRSAGCRKVWLSK